MKSCSLMTSRLGQEEFMEHSLTGQDHTITAIPFIQDGKEILF